MIEVDGKLLTTGPYPERLFRQCNGDQEQPGIAYYVERQTLISQDVSGLNAAQG